MPKPRPGHTHSAWPPPNSSLPRLTVNSPRSGPSPSPKPPTYSPPPPTHAPPPHPPPLPPPSPPSPSINLGSQGTTFAHAMSDHHIQTCGFVATNDYNQGAHGHESRVDSTWEGGVVTRTTNAGIGVTRYLQVYTVLSQALAEGV